MSVASKRRSWSAVVAAAAVLASTALFGIGGAAAESQQEPCVEDCLERLELSTGAALPYYGSYSLEGGTEATSAVIVVHGTNRNADEYFDSMVDVADDAGALADTVVVAPWFQADEDDPEDGDAYWTNGDETSWKDGGDAVSDDATSSFEATDEILSVLADKARFPNLTTITVTGHSAGGQFAQRYAAGAHAPASDVAVRYVVANPSSYMYLNAERPEDDPCDGYDDYKYGLRDRNRYMSQLSDDQLRERYTSRDVTYLLGEEDTTDDGGLDEDCEAMAQGENRLERGRAYYESIKTEFPDAPHAEVLVPGVGHDHTDMFDSAEGRQAIFG